MDFSPPPLILPVLLLSPSLFLLSPTKLFPSPSVSSPHPASPPASLCSNYAFISPPSSSKGRIPAGVFPPPSFHDDMRPRHPTALRIQLPPSSPPHEINIPPFPLPASYSSHFLYRWNSPLLCDQVFKTSLCAKIIFADWRTKITVLSASVRSKDCSSYFCKLCQCRQKSLRHLLRDENNHVATLLSFSFFLAVGNDRWRRDSDSSRSRYQPPVLSFLYPREEYSPWKIYPKETNPHTIILSNATLWRPFDLPSVLTRR